MTQTAYDFSALAAGQTLEAAGAPFSALVSAQSKTGGFGGTTPAGGLRGLNQAAKHVYWDTDVPTTATQNRVLAKIKIGSVGQNSMAYCGFIQAGGACYYFQWFGNNGWQLYRLSDTPVDFGTATLLIEQGSGNTSLPPTTERDVQFDVEVVGGDAVLTLTVATVQVLTFTDSSADKLVSGRPGFTQQNNNLSDDNYSASATLGDEFGAVVLPPLTSEDDPLATTIGTTVTDELNWTITDFPALANAWEQDVLEVRRQGNPYTAVLFRVLSNDASGSFVLKKLKNVTFLPVPGDVVVRHPSANGVKVEEVDGVYTGTVSGTPTTTSLVISSGVAYDGQYVGSVIKMLEGPAAGTPVLITGSVASTNTLTVQALPAAPVAGNAYKIA